MKRKIKVGTTSQRERIFVQNSGATNVAGLTGLTSASSGLKWYYLRDGASSPTSVTLASATVGTFTSGGFKEVDATNMPGIYEIGTPNAAIASGAADCVMMLSGVTNMQPVLLEYELDAIDYQDATALGLSRLDAAVTSRMATFSLPTNFSSFAITPAGRVDVGLIAGNTNAVALDANNLLNVNAKDWNGTATAGMPNTGNVTVGGYAGGQDPGTYVLVTPANKLKLDVAGRVDLSLVKGDADGAEGLRAAGAEYAGEASFSALVQDYDAGMSPAAQMTTQGYTTNRAALLDHLNADVTSRMASGNVTVGGYAAGQDPATLILVTPTNKISTNLSHEVVAASVTGGVGGSLAGDVGGNVVGSVASVTNPVTVGTNNDKTAYKLASDGLDSISTSVSGPASNFRQMVVMVYRRFFRKSTLTSTQLKNYQDDGSTLLTTQSVSDDGTTQTVGDAS